MQNYIPRYIAEKAQSNETSGNFQANTVFIDISGFTSMTQTLMTHGKEGAEILSNIINDIFTPSIEAIELNGGFVTSFAGDAFTAVFETEKAEYPLKAAFDIHDIFDKSGKVHTKFGEFDLAVKIGLSFGNVEYGIIDADVQKTFYFRGEAIVACAESEHHADKMQIIADKAFLNKIEINLETEKTGDHWFLIPPTTLELCNLKQDTAKDLSEDIENEFIPPSVLELTQRGEFREIVSVFISFEEEGEYLEHIKKVIRKTHSYGGYFNKIDFGDKGGVMLVIFGAPSGKEKLYQRAVDLSVSLKNIPGLEFRAGISTGIAYCGIVGSELRREYTALGNVVNLSSRLMIKAGWSEILTGSKIEKNLKDHYIFESKGETEFKGFTEKFQIYNLKNKNANKQNISYSGNLVGRSKELKKLNEYIKPVLDNKSGGIVYIDGPAGIGKSRLISNFVMSVENCNSFLLPCDEILKRSFNPFEYFFKHYFEQSPSYTKEENKCIFKKLFQELLESTPDEKIKEELSANETVLGALIGLSWEDSVFSLLEPKNKYDRSISAVKDFFVSKSLTKPVIIILDDAHWIDSDSLNMLDVLLTGIKNLPVIILALCRFNDDGTEFDLFKTNDTDIKTQRLKLEAFNREMMNELIIESSGTSSIPVKTSDFIWEKSGGNPFFVEQLFLYLTENDLMDDGYNLKSVSQNIPNGISQIILARIDRLSNKMKDTVKTASVLGREFSLRVLEKMLSSNNSEENISLISEIDEGTNEQLWENISELDYIFKHALIRDTVYEIQLKDSLRKLHDLAGSIIEELYSNDIINYIEVIADHYDKAENIDKAILYLKDAAVLTIRNYKNESSMSYLDRLLEYLKDDQYAELAMKVNITRADIYAMIGKMDNSTQCYEEAIILGKQIPDHENVVYCMNEVAFNLRDRGKLEEALVILEECIEIAENAGDEDGKGRAICRKGEVYIQCDRNDEAEECFNTYFELCLKSENKHGMAVAKIDLGNVYTNLMDYDKAEESFLYAIEISEEMEYELLTGNASLNLSVVYYKQEHYDKAEEWCFKGLEISSKFGLKSEIQLAKGYLGRIFLCRGDHTLALEYFEEKLSICMEIEDQVGIIDAVQYIGSVHISKGDQNKALELLNAERPDEQSTAIICNEIWKITKDDKYKELF